MCGICGALALDGGSVEPGGVEAMLAAMVHRGPDAGGRFEAPGVCAGIRRLAVIDVAGGDQPIANEDGSVEVVFNGEIYNHVELREWLEARGHRFRTRSDTEVLVHLWEEDGPRLLERLNGMFAFCLHDRREGRTLIARDRVGIKPLFYRLHANRLAFASEIGVLLRHPEVDPAVDTEALVETCLLQYVSGDATPYREVRKLPPGHLIEVRDGAAELRRWWRLPPAEPSEAASGDLASAAGTLRELLESAVRYRTIADVPLGLFLSGGLDSAVLCSLLAAASDRPVETFSVGFEDAAAHDERRYARLVAEAFGTRHHEQVVSPLDIAADLPRLVDHLKLPVTDPAMLPTWSLASFARERVTVALGGEGSDELFGGYRRYVYQSRFGWVGRLPGARAAGRRLPRRLEQAIEATAERGGAHNHLAWSATIGRRLAQGLFDPLVVDGVLARAAERLLPYFPGDRIALEHSLRADQAQWLPHNLLAKVDHATMAHSLEARVPFLDHRIVEFAATLPAKAKLSGGRTKRVLREAFRERLPAAVLARPKRGFDLPLDDWIRGPLRELARDAIESRGVERWPQLDAAGARRMLSEHLRGRAGHGLPLFLLVSTLTFLEGTR